MATDTISNKTQGLTDQQIKCLECQECCEYVEIPTSIIGGIEVLEYWLNRGNQFYISDIDGLLHMRIKDPCKHLGPSGCKIYEKRPFACRTYICPEQDKSTKITKEKSCEFSMGRISELVKKHNENNIKKKS